MYYMEERKKVWAIKYETKRQFMKEFIQAHAEVYYDCKIQEVIETKDTIELKYIHQSNKFEFYTPVIKKGEYYVLHQNGYECTEPNLDNYKILEMDWV